MALVVLLSLMSTVETLSEQLSDTLVSDGTQSPIISETAVIKWFIDSGYRVGTKWLERSQLDPETLVRGYHLLDVSDSGAIDLYFDVFGMELDMLELERLGIASKNWNVSRAVASEVSKRSVNQPIPSDLPVAPFSGMDFPHIYLEPIDLQSETESVSNVENHRVKGASRIGVLRELDTEIILDKGLATVGTWVDVPGSGRIWGVTVVSAGAVGQRIHFKEFTVPEEVVIRIYNTLDPTEVYGPFRTKVGTPEDFWAPTCFSESVTIECFVPKGIDTSSLRISIDQTAHIYADFEGLLGLKGAGSCNLDIACYPEWESEALGVAGIGTIGSDGVLWCTGFLVGDTDPASEIPYFVTAFHCVSSESGSRGAGSVEAYWFYQRSACDTGEIPNPADVPRTTGGADFLVGSTSSDFTLLRLHELPPPGLTYLGWTTLVPNAGSEVTSIHHPSGDFKRIVFGRIVDQDEVEHEVQWSQGTTEVGSSGSPLFMSDSGLIVGQLQGGLASCFRLDSSDFYGRFDLSFPLAESWLAPAHAVADIDFSGTIDSVDIQLVVNAALGFPVAYSADVDASGFVNAVDIQIVLNSVINSSATVD